LVLTLTEEEIRLFADLYQDSLREDQRQSGSRDSWIRCYEHGIGI